MQGRVHWFNYDKGYGFISAPDNKQIFIHQKNIVGMPPGQRTLNQDDIVEFQVVDNGEKGQQAVNCRLVRKAR